MIEAAAPTQPEGTRPAGLLVVDDHDLVRLGLRTLVQAQAAANAREVKVFEARTLQDALAVYGTEQAGIGLVLLDLHLPDAHGLSGLTTFIGQFPQANVVVLSGVSDPALVREALAHGAQAYLTKSGDLQHVVHYIRSLGLLRNPGPVASRDASDFAGLTAVDDTDIDTGRWVATSSGQQVRLTARQSELLDWILTGQSNREIADRAHLSEGTVKNHVSTLLLIFGVRSRAQLISQLR
jgi:DNA-binding NarL/FixJ family response regulator